MGRASLREGNLNNPTAGEGDRTPELKPKKGGQTLTVVPRSGLSLRPPFSENKAPMTTEGTVGNLVLHNVLELNLISYQVEKASDGKVVRMKLHQERTFNL
jgi:hypothetical protein